MVRKHIMEWLVGLGWLLEPSTANLGQVISAIATSITALVATVAAVLGIRQLKGSLKTAQGDFLLRLSERVQKYNSTHDRLEAGKWLNPTQEDVGQARRYMG